MTCEKSVRPVFTVMPPIGKIEEFTAKPLRRVQIDTNQNPLQIIDNARLFRQTRELNRTAVKEHKKPKADKNRPKAKVSAYKTAQAQAKPGSSPFAKKV